MSASSTPRRSPRSAKPPRSGSSPSARAPQSDESTEIVIGLRRIVRAIEQYSQEVSKEYGLTGPQLWAMKTLLRSGPLLLGELAEALAVQPSTLSILIDRLEARGLVERIRGRPDRRLVEVALTRAGVRLATNAPEAAQGRLLHGLRVLRPAERRNIGTAIARLVSMMEAADLEARFFFSDD